MGCPSSNNVLEHGDYIHTVVTLPRQRYLVYVLLLASEEIIGSAPALSFHLEFFNVGARAAKKPLSNVSMLSRR